MMSQDSRTPSLRTELGPSSAFAPNTVHVIKPNDSPANEAAEIRRPFMAAPLLANASIG